MERIRKYIWNIEAYLLPVAILLIVLIEWNDSLMEIIFGWPVLGPMLGVGFALWLLVVLIQLVLLMLSQADREFFVKKLAGFVERDEREEWIVAQATRFSFILTTSLVIILFCLSTIRYTHPVDGNVPKGYHSVTVGSFSLYGDVSRTFEKQLEGGPVVQMMTEDLPISKSAQLLLILFALVGGFSVRARRLRKQV